MTTTQELYLPQMATLGEVIDETPTIRTLVVHPPEPMHFKAGQFIQLTLPGVGEAPFTPSSSPTRPDRLEITVLRTGEVTERLHRCTPGEDLGLRGPFGKGYPLEKLEGREVIVVGGGVGLAPLRALVLAVLDQPVAVSRMRIFYGARSMEELLYRRQHEHWGCRRNVDLAVSIDRPQRGWEGHVGVVTTLLDELNPSEGALAFVCGPSIMLKFATAKLLEEGLAPEQIYLSMNRRMSCGVGKCGRCNIGPYYLCKDGPDINYAKIKDYPNVF